ncbi:MAG: ATP-binding cassette domain-containing protein, partial [Parachlamydia sp.]|nr:ATP-binding cassette domain-containing protein [Parachlamydia sp.]
MIRIRNLSKHYRTSGNKIEARIEALSDISLDVDKGDIFGIIGQSGAGKSTLIRCLATLERPEAGEILFENQDIVKMDADNLRHFRQNIGMIFQHFNLLSSRNVAENVSYPIEIQGVAPEERKKRVDEVLELVGLSHKREAYPAHLSGGQKQRVGIARALACNPSVLLSDEATSALDPKTTRDILMLLKQLNQRLGLTIVLITHDIEVVKQICNKVAVLDHGLLVETGTIAQIFSDPHHATTRQFLQNTIHDVPAGFFKDITPFKKVFRLTFKGQKTCEPIISRMVKRFDVEVNILVGWVDVLQGLIIGNLVLELSAPEPNLSQALAFL